MKGLIRLSIIALSIAGCGFIPEKVDIGDPRVQSLLKVASSFDRTSYGFSSIPNEAKDVRLALRPTDRYDAMLHIDSKTSRTIAFRKVSGGYRWIGEQESFRGPKRYTNVDGMFYEQVVLNYDIEKVSGDPTNVLVVSYWGEDSRLSNGGQVRKGLTLNDVKPILKEWGY